MERTDKFIDITTDELEKHVKGKQLRVARGVIESALEQVYDKPNAEIKRIRIAWIGGKILMICVVSGKKGDDNTTGSLFCRNHGMFTIGPRGALSSVGFSRDELKERKITQWKLWKYPLIYGWRH